MPTRGPSRATRTALLIAGAVALLSGGASAQTTYQLDSNGQWRPVSPAPEPARNPKAVAPAGDEAFMDEMRRLIAEGKGEAAKKKLDKWIATSDRARNPWFPEALLLRGNAKLVDGEEFDALYDYERLAREFAASEAFVPALEKEFEVAELYLNGRRKKAMGIRIESGKPFAEEIILRINERLPGSKLAEKALLRLADYYYDTRQLQEAGETYDVFLQLYPRSAARSRALQRRVFANIAQYKGPRYDSQPLSEAKFQIEDLQREFPQDAQALGLTDGLTARLDESQARSMFVAAQWYLEKGDEPAARLTFARVVRLHPGTATAQEALDICLKKGWALPGAEAKAPDAPKPDAKGATK